MVKPPPLKPSNLNHPPNPTKSLGLMAGLNGGKGYRQEDLKF